MVETWAAAAVGERSPSQSEKTRSSRLDPVLPLDLTDTQQKALALLQSVRAEAVPPACVAVGAPILCTHPCPVGLSACADIAFATALVPLTDSAARAQHRQIAHFRIHMEYCWFSAADKAMQLFGFCIVVTYITSDTDAGKAIYQHRQPRREFRQQPHQHSYHSSVTCGASGQMDLASAHSMHRDS